LTGTAPVEHDAVVPLFNPVQLHVHGPDPLTEDAVPAVQRLVVGIEPKLAPFDDPQAPLVMRLAEQLAFVPLYWPTQVQAQGPDPLTEDAVPAEHRLTEGAELKLPPFDDPHDPFMASIVPVAQLTADPPFIPAQLHVHGPEPETEDAVPAEQRLAEGVEEKL
jgi:hypothetical protein